MKEKNLTKIFAILVIVIISLASFVGIYVRKSGVMENILPEYTLSSNLGGLRQVVLSVKDETQQIVYDSEGKTTDDGYNEDGTLKEGYTVKEEKINPDEVLTKENYDEVKNILRKRLTSFAVEDYILRQNAETGEFTIELPENTVTDEVISYLTFPGKFEVKDHDTGDVLMDNSYIEEAKPVYGTTDSGTVVYLNIEFNKEGRQKLEEITNTYVKSTDEEGNDTTKNICLEIDGETLLETYFEEPITNGNLQLTFGSTVTSNEELTNNVRQCASVAALINNRAMPVEYELAENRYVSAYTSDLTILVILLAAIIGIAVIVFALWCIRYKLNGVMASIITVGFAAILLIMLRFANVMISEEAIVAIIALLVLEIMFLNEVMKNLVKINSKKEVVKQVYKKYASILFPLAIIAVVFTFASWVSVASIGMVLFWGLVILAIYNYIFIEALLEVKEIKKA